jgi:hypothetical protein
VGEEEASVVLGVVNGVEEEEVDNKRGQGFQGFQQFPDAFVFGRGGQFQLEQRLLFPGSFQPDQWNLGQNPVGSFGGQQGYGNSFSGPPRPAMGRGFEKNMGVQNRCMEISQEINNRR